MSVSVPPLTERELAVLELATEDAYALFEVASAVGGDLVVAAEVVRHLLRLGLIELGIEDWSTEPPGHVVDGQYVGIPFEGDVEATLADPASWGTVPRRVVVSATDVGYERYMGTVG